MYYHCRELKYTEHGKVYPAPVEVIDSDFLKMYKWLGKYCGFSPQIWLSRSKSQITGYKYKKRRDENEEWIMFGFDIIKGFPVHFDRWEFLMGELMTRQNIKMFIEETIADFKTDRYDISKDSEFKYLLDYASMGEEAFLKRYLFVEHDQVVVPTLNLKSAKVVFCRDERQKKKLKKMGFIDDRIKILNIKYPYSS